MDAFPAYFPLAGQRVVLVGEGEGARAKARLLAGSPAQIVTVDAQAGADPGAYAGAVLAFVALDDDDQARAAVAAARAAGVPVNAVDRPALCDFTTPAIVDRGAVVAAVGTGGAAPALASLLRADLEARLPQGIGALAGLLGALQGELRAALPDSRGRRAFLRAALAGPAAEAALAGALDRARTLLVQGMAGFAASQGALRLLDGAGPADLLTLRAARALGEADLLVIDTAADQTIAVLARRDAPRLAEIAPQALAARLAEGLQIVWITGPGAAAGMAARLAADGVGAQILPRGR